MRIIPCLDVANGKVVKGTNFKNIKAVADPLALAKKYAAEGADELVFYDINASLEARDLFYETIQTIRNTITIPFTVGGGVQSLTAIEKLLELGVDKVSINSAAIKRGEFLAEAVNAFGSKRIVLGMDVKKIMENKWHVFAQGGRVDMGIDALFFAKTAADYGVGEIVVNSIDGDGVKRGYDLLLTKNIAEATGLPVIASGGAGKKEDFLSAFTKGKASGALAASIFHYNELTIQEIKQYLAAQLGAEQ